MNYMSTMLLALRTQPVVTTVESMRSAHVATTAPSQPAVDRERWCLLSRQRSRRTILLLMIIGVSMSLPSGFALFVSSKHSQNCKAQRKSGTQECVSAFTTIADPSLLLCTVLLSRLSLCRGPT
jgi:hypothetical protein